MTRPRSTPSVAGFTLLELMITCAILVIIATMGFPIYQRTVSAAKEISASADLREISQAIDLHILRTGEPPASLAEIQMDHMLDPWGHPYEYLRLMTSEDPSNGNGNGNGKGKGNGNGGNGNGNGGSTNVGKARKDHNLVPINTDYDLYSMGADGKSASPLTAAISRDDIVRAQNGSFFGLASEY
ncbi:MAG: prepilin-type N-terminal cleavage/methylation domain-containing protein [Planctomycetes bacterium]|nr:prepilin-type N-terminal cleavage/methylation domain-containing protein [Planctomycetota bacterium]